MSSRALRKAQRELEEKKRLEQTRRNVPDDESEESEEIEKPKFTGHPSFFSLLSGEDAAEEEEGDAKLAQDQDHDVEPVGTGSDQAVAVKSKKKKKKKKKATVAIATGNRALVHVGLREDGPRRGSRDITEGLDEIDVALRQLALKQNRNEDSILQKTARGLTESQKALYELLSIDTQYLHAANEMRKLFGRAAMQAGAGEENAGRRRGEDQQGIAAAVAGRNAPGGRGNLASLALRKNIFIQGKEEWPRATSGGLGMEVLAKNLDGTTEFRFTHNTQYQNTQKEFQICVGSMDPNRMVQLLQYNPFHISTLLQVSEICKQSHEPATAGDLLERALFSFGRAIHSTFTTNLSQGKARLEFERPENREFWLAAWRYINSLRMRATWRTSLEWALLLLSLDPNSDPYCVCLVVDELAVRARQYQKLIDLWKSSYFHKKWKTLGSMGMSVALAYFLSGEPALGRSLLINTIENHPWITMRLLQDLDIEPLPPKIWGRFAPTPTDKLFTELYVTRAKDIWKSDEAKSFLIDGAFSASPPQDPAGQDYSWINPRNYTRHTILTDNPSLISLAPQELTSKLSSVADPLPPLNDMTSYTIDTSTSSESSRNRNTNNENPRELLNELTTLQAFFRSILPWFGEGQGAINPDTGQPPTEEELERRIMESGVDPRTIVERTQRMQELQAAIERQIEDIDAADALEEELGGALGREN